MAGCMIEGLDCSSTLLAGAGEHGLPPHQRIKPIRLSTRVENQTGALRISSVLGELPEWHTFLTGTKAWGAIKPGILSN